MPTTGCGDNHHLRFRELVRLLRIWSGTTILPMSWTTPAALKGVKATGIDAYPLTDRDAYIAHPLDVSTGVRIAALDRLRQGV